VILVIDHTNVVSRVAAVSARPPSRPVGAVWYSAPAGRSVMSALSAARRRKAFAGKPECVVVVLGAVGAARDVSWSAIRSAVASANAFAFASGALVATVTLSGTETDIQIEARARAAAKQASRGVWAGAAYNAEPSITQKKQQ